MNRYKLYVIVSPKDRYYYTNSKYTKSASFLFVQIKTKNFKILIDEYHGEVSFLLICS